MNEIEKEKKLAEEKKRDEIIKCLESKGGKYKALVDRLKARNEGKIETGGVRLRHKTLSEKLGIPLAELEKKNSAEIRKLFEDNAEKLGVKIFRFERKPTEKSSRVINKPWKNMPGGESKCR